MKLLMENWRTFINEEVYGEEFLKTLGLTYQMIDGDFEIQVIHKNETNGQISVIGMIETMEMAKKSGGKPTPCIPETQEVGAVAVDPAFQGKGLGTWLYEVVSVLISKKRTMKLIRKFNLKVEFDYSASSFSKLYAGNAPRSFARLQEDL